MIANERVAEVVSRLTGVPREELKRGIPPELPVFVSADSLDRMELILELEEEFDEETVGWALRYIEALAERSETRRSKGQMPSRSEGPDSLWDRHFDG